MNRCLLLLSLSCACLAAFFSPPARYENVMGNYRSPLLFYSGDTVKTPEEWSVRRREIRDRWMQMMGEWPSLITESTFEYLASVRRDGYMEYKVRFEWIPAGRKTVGYLLKPDRKGKLPAVITVYYEPETAIGAGGKPNRDFARLLAQHGFASLSIGTSEIIRDETFVHFYPDCYRHKIEPLSLLAYAAANAWQALSKVSYVDSSRIGIWGHSYGGKWAMFASCLFDRFACAAWSDPGIVFDESRPDVNYWEPYYLGYHTPPWRKRGIITEDNPAKGLYVKLREEGYNLHELHALMAPRPFLVSGGSEDTAERWIPLNHSMAVNRLLGYKERVAMSNRKEHAPDEESNKITLAFFTCYLY
jgi:dienelactone hydrolase